MRLEFPARGSIAQAVRNVGKVAKITAISQPGTSMLALVPISARLVDRPTTGRIARATLMRFGDF
jgi:hypothetical protein